MLNHGDYVEVINNIGEYWYVDYETQMKGHYRIENIITGYRDSYDEELLQKVDIETVASEMRFYHQASPDGNYSLEHALKISDYYLQRANYLQHSEILSDEHKDKLYAGLMTDLENLGVPVLLSQSTLDWLHSAEGNRTLFETYQEISDMRNW